MIRIGLIGCGFMGSMHANCYRAIEGVTVTAVADIRPEKAAAAAALSGAVIYKTGEELIRSAEVDAIDICLPTFLHASHALLAMDKVRHVFIEKPVCRNVAEGEALLKKQAETGANVQVGQVMRFWDEYTYLKELIDSGRYGKVTGAMFRRISPRPTWGWENWLANEERSGGAALDLHIHDTDYLLHAFGKPQDVISVTNTVGETDSYICSTFRYPGFVAVVEGGWDFPGGLPFEMSFRVSFERVTVMLSPAGFFVYPIEGGVETPVLEKAAPVKSADAGGNISDLGGYYRELVYFTDRIAAGEKSLRATLPEAVESVRFVLLEKEIAKKAK